MNKQWTQNRKPFEMEYEDYWNYPTVNKKKKNKSRYFSWPCINFFYYAYNVFLDCVLLL